MPQWIRATPTPRHADTAHTVSGSQMPNYQLMSGYYWSVNRLDIPGEGWKLHVSCDERYVQTILAAVLPVLRNATITHKFLLTYGEVRGMRGPQKGKVLAVYPQDIAEAFRAVGLIDGALIHRSITRLHCPVIPNEIPVGRTVVYARYGAFNSSIYDQTGTRLINDPIGVTHPAWIANPWPLYPNAAAVAGFAPWPAHGRQANRRRGR